MTRERAIPSDLDTDIVREIDARLAALEREENVALGFAIESGSRAWGFPSPDSDYDCRFVFIRARRDYLSLFPKRDVIELPLTEVFDVNGWDLSKAVKLLLGGNAVIVEWLTSPIVYRAEPEFCERFLELARNVGDRDRFAHHYIRLGRRLFDDGVAEGKNVPVKKIFYVLRPAMTLRWLAVHPEARIAPMNIQDLMAGADLPREILECIDDLLIKKAATRELGRGVAPPPIAEFVSGELRKAEENFNKAKPATDESRERAEIFFRWAIERYALD